jgi:diacylglycerol kinase
MYSRSLFQSFKLAWAGLWFVFKTERNMKLHCLAAATAVICSVAFKISEIEFIFVIFSIVLVFVTEVANTAFELLLDFVHGDKFHPNVKLLKDIVAGGVFIAAVNAFVIGFIIFIPRVSGLAKAFFNF